ncbi:MAG: [NiFe] hydrogenase metallocenter assembly protein HypF [uncultured Sulfurovum sp.]|uniref:Carbamoyltransferase n=1 Tax=uncultured Sulfurovum sp. TaxID=269237 RepID=A0A6S6SQV9_9BACT|nr:MAG: [NiFe] hydrogenase metallocenter assembly protein HypF [uncultured Sulfurovum sp.]
MELCTYKVTIKGTVQGVGFRPFIYALAKRYLFTGTVSNNSHGVEIVLNIDLLTFKQFLIALEYEYPPLASIESIDYVELDYESFDGFSIIETTEAGDVAVNIPADVSICKDCEKELLDPNNRRFNYPFITCTHCGVRYSIIYDLPYDRVNTSMKFFEMCKGCKEEYTNPLDRRYHAQPIGCWDCGPSLELVGQDISKEKIVDEVVELIEEGNILAIKGVGGYHLVCDATNNEAVQKLRERKQRPSKPFAVMVQNLEMAHKLAEINKKEALLLNSKERPIVLLNAKKNDNILSSKIAPNISRLGLFLPYTPLHLLIFQKLNSPLVATSANVTDEPIATNRESIEQLAGVYDYLLDHKRKIVNACDDSVLMVVKNQEIILRRARGYAPVSMELPFKLEKKVLAVGANQKSTVAIGFDKQVILSPHIGDLDGISSVEYFQQNIENLKRIYRFEPEVIAHDKHPNYESTKVAKQEAKEKHLELMEIQHHYAHILGVMVEKKINQKVLGVAFDGTGYGDDGNLWGGEFMLCDYDGYERVAQINYFKLLGGAKAIKEPKRVALSLLFDLYGEEALAFSNATTEAFIKSEFKTQYLIWQKGLNSPLSSSVGRLFDAVASLTGICQVMSFEGESGMLMEEYYDETIIGFYDFTFDESIIGILPMVKQISEESNPAVAISKFFNTLVEIIDTLHKKYDLPLVLSGGVFQNRILLALVLERIPTAMIGNKIPPNDGGIALGQSVARINYRKNND